MLISIPGPHLASLNKATDLDWSDVSASKALNDSSDK